MSVIKEEARGKDRVRDLPSWYRPDAVKPPVRHLSTEIKQDIYRPFLLFAIEPHTGRSALKS